MGTPLTSTSHSSDWLESEELFYCVYHFTNVPQPLDVGAFGPVKNCMDQNQYKMETCAAVVDKTVFPNFCKLWDASFQPHLLAAGFRRAGLFPLFLDSIPKSSYAPAIPQARDHDQQPTPQLPRAHDGPHRIEVSVKCSEYLIEVKLTPIRVYLRGYFATVIGGTKANGRKLRKRVKTLYSGEALTTDDIYERLEDDDKKKQRSLSKLCKSTKKRCLRTCT